MSVDIYGLNNRLGHLRNEVLLILEFLPKDHPLHESIMDLWIEFAVPLTYISDILIEGEIQ